MTSKIITTILFVMATGAAYSQTIVTESTSNSTTKGTTETTVNSPPPSAIAPSINSMNNDLCTVGVSGAAQTQIFGVAIGTTHRDENCERLKLAKNLYDMGMKVAAVATLCQDERVFVAMSNAGTPCPINGKIGAEAIRQWEQRDLSAVDARKELGTTGFYRAPISANSNKSCAAYSGDDPIVRERMCQ